MISYSLHRHYRDWTYTLQGVAGLMQWPEFRRIGFAGKTKICCAPPYQS